MSTLIANANGNLTATSWGVVNATGTTFLNSEAANTALTTALVASQTFTPGAITIDGIAVKVASRAASPSGTMDIELATGGVQVAGTSVQINVADLPLCSTGAQRLEGGWAFFKFAAPVLLVAATAYTVRAKTSVASQVNLFRDVTGGNWSRALRTTTSAAPAAGDDMIIVGEMTGAGAITSRTITMDQTAATDYGSNVTGANGLIAPALAIGNGGTLTFGTTASTNYVLRLSGNLIVYASGVLNIGTVGTPIPRTSTAWLEFDCAADLNFGLTVRNLGAYSHVGLSRTSGKDVWYCRLNTDEAVNSTSLGVDTDTGWLDNDLIAISTTTATSGQSEKGALNGAAGASTLTVDGFAGAAGGLAFAHSGTAPYQAYVILLTRNTGVRAVTSGLTSFLIFRDTPTIYLSWVEFYYLGASGQSGITSQITTGAGSIFSESLSIHDCDGTGWASQAAGATALDNHDLNNFALFAAPITINADCVTLAFGGSASSMSGLIAIKTQTSASAISITRLKGVMEDFVAVGGSTGISVDCTDGDDGTLRRVVALAGAVSGIDLTNGQYELCTFADFSLIRNGGSQGGLNSSVYSGFIDGLTCIGNAPGVGSASLRNNGHLRVRNFVSDKDSLNATGHAIRCDSGSVIVDNGDLGMASAHGVSTVIINNAGVGLVILNNVNIGDAVVSYAATMEQWTSAARVSLQRKNETDGVHITYLRAGSIEADASTYHTAGPSEKLTPLAAAAGTTRLISSSVLVAVDASDTKTISVWVRKDTTYSGGQPRLLLRANAAVGVDVDTVLDTMSVGTGSWEQLSGTTPAAIADGAFELVVDLIGTAGFINVDDWAVAP